MKRLLLILLICLAGCAKKNGPQSPAFPVTTVRPIVCDVPQYLDYVGHIEALSTVQVTSQIEGVLKHQYFKEGQSVKEGDLLFLIDPRPYQAALEKAEAELAQNVAHLKYAEDTVQRYSKLAQEDYISQLDFDKYITNVMVDKAAVKENLATIDQAKLNLEYCYIRSPINGIAGIVTINVGNLIPNAGSTPLVTLKQISPIYASFYIPEKDLPCIQNQQNKSPLKTEVILNEITYDGMLALIDNRVDEDTGMIFLKAILPNEDQNLWPGEFIDVRVILDVQKNALLLPTEAIQIGQNGMYVFVVQSDNTVDIRVIHAGQKYNAYTLVKDGITADDVVVLEGQVNLYKGARVESGVKS